MEGFDCMKKREIETILSNAQIRAFAEIKDSIDPSRYDRTDEGIARFQADVVGACVEMSGRVTISILEQLGILDISD